MDTSNSDYTVKPDIYDSILTDVAICDIRLENSDGQFTTFTSYSEDGSKPSLSMSLDMEDNLESSGNNCTLKVYNLIIDKDKYNTDTNTVQHWVKADIYWRTKPQYKTSFKFLVDPENLTTERSGSDWVTTMKGTLGMNALFSSPIDPMVFADTGQLCTSFSMFKERMLQYYSIDINTDNVTDIPKEYVSNVIVTNRSPSEIFEKEYMLPYFVNHGYFYRLTSVYGVTLFKNNSQLKREDVYCTILYDSLYEYAKSSTQIKIKCHGIPGLLKGECFNIAIEDYDKYGAVIKHEVLTYVVDEINIHYDDTSDGFTNEITATAVEKPDEPKQTVAPITQEGDESSAVCEPEKAVTIIDTDTVIVDATDMDINYVKAASNTFGVGPTEFFKEYTANRKKLIYIFPTLYGRNKDNTVYTQDNMYSVLTYDLENNTSTRGAIINSTNKSFVVNVATSEKYAETRISDETITEANW